MSRSYPITLSFGHPPTEWASMALLPDVFIAVNLLGQVNGCQEGLGLVPGLSVFSGRDAVRHDARARLYRGNAVLENDRADRYGGVHTAIVSYIPGSTCVRSTPVALQFRYYLHG